MATCGRCGGKGKVDCGSQERERVILCPGCLGTGEYPPLSCPDCGGRGTIGLRPRKLCGRCRGRGVIKR
jgi:DnaJ-class molecular chaperone